MIYLTHARTAYTEESELLTDITYPQRVHWFPESYAKTRTGLVYVPHWVMQKVLDPSVAAAVKLHPAKTAFIFASGNSTLAGSSRKTRDTQLSYSYKFLPLTLTNIYAGRTAQQFGQVDLVQTDASACASSLKVLMDVQTLVRMYGYQRVIVLTGEDQVSNSVLDFFGETKASLQADDTRLPSAFDPVNGGFYVGQGAALAVFETEEARTAEPIARLVGAYAASEASTNAIGQLDSGEGFIKAMQGALAGHGRAQIGVVKAHGTGTQSNDVAECAALDWLGEHALVTSLKPTIGHTMGASGLLESILLIQSLRTGKMPAIRNRTVADSRFLSEDAPAPKGLLMSLAAGMGNIYAAAVFDWRV